MSHEIFLSREQLVLVGAILSALGLVLYNRWSISRRRSKFMKEHGALPAKRFPLKDPILGLDFFMEYGKCFYEHRALESMTERYEELGNTFSGKNMADNFIYTNEPENVKAVLSINFKDFSLGHRNSYMGQLMGCGIFNSDGERWAESRHMIRPNFSRDQVADLSLFERHLETMLGMIPRDGSTVDLQQLFFSLTIDTATEFLFGHSCDSLLDTTGEGAQFSSVFDRALKECLSRLIWNIFNPLRFTKDYKDGMAATKKCKWFADKYIDDAIRYRKNIDQEKEATGGQTNYVFLHELSKVTSDRIRLRDELLNVMIAGRDTTAATLTHMFFLVSRKPEVFQKLRADIEFLDGKPPTYEQLRDLKYVKWCINETLRLLPPVPGNNRQALRDVILPTGGGPDGKSPLFVPKGTVVWYIIYAMHRRKDFWGDDAEEFRPERWDGKRTGWEYLPFNGGPRICIGQQYAITEVAYTVVRLVQSFKDIECRDPVQPFIENLGITLSSLNGAKVALTPV